MNNVLNFLKSLDIDNNEPLVVACSGGSDSMFLLYLLKSLNYNVICAHVNHKVRRESDSEYNFVKNYCNKYDIVFEGTELTGYTSGNFEHFAREFRYNFFEIVLKKYNSKYLFTAHHGDDLIETIMMRLVRGSSLKGYKGFDFVTKRDSYKIVRPLIYLTKEEIENIMHDKDISYVVDESNYEDDYTRNRFRHHLLPFLKSEEAFVHEKFIKFNQEIGDAYNYINSVVDEKIKDIYVEKVLDINKFNEQDDYIKKNILIYILDLLYPDNLYLINSNHVLEIMKLTASDKKNISTTLPNNVIVRKEYNKLYFDVSELAGQEFDYLLTDGLLINEYEFRFHDTASTSNNVIRLNSKDIKLPLRVRTRKLGDKMCVKNLKGSKKINDIFIDNKVILAKRNVWPVVVDANNTILWLPGLKKSDFDIPINEEYDIIIEYSLKGDEIYE